MPQLPRSTSVDTLRHDCKDLGLLVARLLAGAWRDRTAAVSEGAANTRDSQGSQSEIPAPISAAELTEITPLLCRSGAGALAWRQIRDTPLGDTAAGRELHEVYRRFRLAALLHERELAHVFSLLHDEGIEAVLVKGWSIARRYPDRALRPYGDIDLCVAPDQFARAERVLAGLPNIDLHRGFTRIGQRKTVQRPTSNVQRQKIQQEWDELFARTKVVYLTEPSRSPTVREGSLIFVERNSGTKALPDGRASAWDPTVREGSGRVQPRMSTLLTEPGAVATGSNVQRPKSNVLSEPEAVATGSQPHSTSNVGLPIRILADEDHLRLLSIHLLRSGARRPPWLCDVALLLDEVQRPSGSPTVRKGFGSVQSVLPRTDFDWDVCLGTNRVQANWVLTAITLAQEVLGAGLPEVRGQKTEVRRQRTESALFKLERQELPRWLVPAVLKQWGGRVQLPSRSPTVREGFGSAPGSINSQRALPNVRASAWSSLYQRWDNPIRATAAVGGRFNNWPRLPYRLAESMMRVTELWKAEGRGQRTEGRGQRAEGRGQRAEGRGQRPGIRSWRLARGRNF